MKKLIALLTTISFLLLGYTLYDYRDFDGLRSGSATETGTTSAREVKEHLDSLSTIAKISADSLADIFRSGSLDIVAIKELLRSESKKLDFLAGITIAFEPYAFSEDIELLGLFYQSKLDDFTNIEDQYNYRDSSLSTSQWYSRPIQLKGPALSPPYFGEAAQELLIEFSIPIYKMNKVGEEEIYAVLSYSLSPDRFTEVVNSFVNGNSGYAYLSNAAGDIITHPNRNFVLKRKILDFEYQDIHKELIAKLNKNLAGHINYKSPYTGVQSILFFETLDITKWRIAVVYSSSDLLGSPVKLEQKIINIALSASFLILFGLMLVLKIDWHENHDLWKLSAIVSILFVLNIATIWVIQLDIDYSEELKDRTRVYSNNALDTYVSKRNYEQKLLGKMKYTSIPTGFFINELLVSDSYNMSISGKIWQKWPVENDLSDKIGFQFLQASPSGRSVIVELMSKDRLDSATWLYTWKFNATLRIFFDYNQYPLDQHYIDIKLVYPDMTDNIMLVPDFKSYEVLNPSSKPGMSNDIFLPRHRIIASYFSFSSLDMKTFFGHNRLNTTPQYESLEYNIVIKRRFITPFVSFVIPFILGAAIIFFLLYSLNKNRDDNSGVTVMGVVQGMAALFFSILLAHITIRNKIPTPQITYLETFYFVIYLFIILLIIIVMMYTGSNKYRLLNYKDNIIVKVVYWPLLYGLLYFITLIKFY